MLHMNALIRRKKHIDMFGNNGQHVNSLIISMEREKLTIGESGYKICTVFERFFSFLEV